MNATTERQPTCAERVHAAAESRLEALRAMLNPSVEDLQFDGHAAKDVQFVLEDYEICWLSHDEIRDLADLPDLPHDRRNWAEDQRAEILAAVFDQYEDEIRETGREAFSEYGLAFDYVEPGTFPDQEKGFFRYQISWGGPSEEIRFYASRGHDGWHLYRAEFWYLDWFDGAPEIVTHDPRAIAVWSEFNDTETVEHVFNQAMEA